MKPRRNATFLDPTRPLCVVGCLVLALTIGACDRAVYRGEGSARPAPLAQDSLAGVELVGVARGPLPGLGPQIQVHAFVRADGSIRADLDHVPDHGRPVHETLVWTPEVAFLFDRARLTFTDLGDEPGVLEALGAQFEVADAIWLLSGRSVLPQADAAQWQRRGSEWRGRSAAMGRRAPATGAPSWSELVWRDAAEIQTLSRRSDRFDRVHGMEFPTALSIEGASLEAPLVVDWKFVRPFTALGDSILDPVWEPSRP